MRQLLTRRISPAVAFILILLIALLAGGTLVFGGKTGRAHVSTISEAVVTVDGEGKKLALPAVLKDLSAGTEVTVSFSVLAAPGDALLFGSVYAPVTILAGDEKIYEYGEEGSYPGFMNDPPTLYDSVLLPYAGGREVPVRIIYRSPQERGSLSIHAPAVGEEREITRMLMERYGLQMTLALLSESIPVYNPEKYCDNVVVGAALGFYIQTAREEGVKIRVRVQVPATNRDISDASLCVIFGNLLENAIEACRLVKGERFIKLSARVNGEMLFITMDNCSPGGSVQKSGGLFASVKGAGRGLGLSSVCSIAERHGGSARFRDENGVFQSEVCVRL